MHSNNLGCPKIFPLVCSNFVLVIASDMLLESESEKGAENVDFRTAKNIQIQPKPDGLWIHTDSFSLFLDQFLETDLRPIYCSRTTAGPGARLRSRPFDVTGLKLTWLKKVGDVAQLAERAWDRHVADAGSIPRCGKGFFFFFFPDSTFSEVSLTVSVHPCVRSRAFKSVRTLNIL